MIIPDEYLSPKQLDDFRAHENVCRRAWADGTHHWQRVAKARETIQPCRVEHCVVYTKPHNLEECAVEFPDPWAIAELMHGGIHPPLSAQLEQKFLLVAKSGKYDVLSRIDVPEWSRKNAPIMDSLTVDCRRTHLEVEGPLTYEQAIEYVICMSIPVAVWGRQHNQRQFVIMSKYDLPDRSTRGAWKLAEMQEAA